MEHTVALSRQEVIWALGSLCSLNRVPFDGELLSQQLYAHPPYPGGPRSRLQGRYPRPVACQSIHQLFLPCVALVHERSPVATAAPGDTQAADPSVSSSGDALAPTPAVRLVLIVKADADRLLVFAAGSQVPTVQPLGTFALHGAGHPVRSCHGAGDRG